MTISKKTYANLIKAEVVNFLPEKLRTVKIEVVETLKANDTHMTGLLVQTGTNYYAPIVYIDSYYEQSQKIEEASKKIAKEIVYAMESCPIKDHSWILDYQKAKNHLFIKMGAIKQNAEYAKDAVCFHSCGGLLEFVGLQVEKDATIKVTSKMLQEWGITLEQIHNDARECMNKKRILFAPVFPSSIAQLQNQNLYYSDKPVEMELLYVLSNEELHYGAYTITNMEALCKVRYLFGQDYYILPSSVNEVLVVAADNIDAAYLNNIVREVNETVVDPTDQLGDEIFRFDLKNGLETYTQYISRITSQG